MTLESGIRRRSGSEGEAGQASVELVAALPLILFATLVVAQTALAGHALWSAAVAARAGARAAHVGRAAETVARVALPQGLRDGARIRLSSSRAKTPRSDAVAEGSRTHVAVSVRTPRLIPGLPVIRVSARSGFRVADD